MEICETGRQEQGVRSQLQLKKFLFLIIEIIREENHVYFLFFVIAYVL